LGNASHSLAVTGLDNIEGKLLKHYGLGSKKRDGSLDMFFYVKDVDAMNNNVSSNGIMQHLNDSNMLSKIAGGKLFGAGGFFSKQKYDGKAAGPVINIPKFDRASAQSFNAVNLKPVVQSATQAIHIDARQNDPALVAQSVHQGMVSAAKFTQQTTNKMFGDLFR